MLGVESGRSVLQMGEVVNWCRRHQCPLNILVQPCGRNLDNVDGSSTTHDLQASGVREELFMQQL